MSALRQSLADYLSLRRSLGYQLERPEKLLGQFLDYLDERGASTITTDLALSWARLPHDASPLWWAHRLTVVRGFAGYLHVLDETHEVPPTDVLPWKSHRASPFSTPMPRSPRCCAQRPCCGFRCGWPPIEL